MMIRSRRRLSEALHLAPTCSTLAVAGLRRDVWRSSRGRRLRAGGDRRGQRDRPVGDVARAPAAAVDAPAREWRVELGPLPRRLPAGNTDFAEACARYRALLWTSQPARR